MMKKRRATIYALFLCLSLCLLFPLRTAALEDRYLQTSANWPGEKTLAMNWNANVPYGTVTCWLDDRKPSFYFSLQLPQSTLQDCGECSVRVIMKDGTERYLLDFPCAARTEQKGPFFTGSQYDWNAGSGALRFTAGIDLQAEHQYEITLIFTIAGRESRLQAPLVINTTTPTFTEATTEKTAVGETTAEKATTKKHAKETTKKAAEKTEKASSAKKYTTADKQTASARQPSVQTKNDVSALEAASETLLVQQGQNHFFAHMSKPTRVVLIAAVILGIMALVIVGMAVGNHMADKKGRAQEAPVEKKSNRETPEPAQQEEKEPSDEER